MIFSRFHPQDFWPSSPDPEESQHAHKWPDECDVMTLTEAREEVRMVLRASIKVQEERALLIGVLETIASPNTFPLEAKNVAERYLRMLGERSQQ